MMDPVSLTCLALTVYFEARSEPVQAQAAVAQVVLNRVEHDAFPDTVCEVVEQGSPEGDALPTRYACQFSWRCDGKSDKPRNLESYLEAWAVAQHVIAGYLDGGIGSATDYHATYVQPGWRLAYEPVSQVGTHIFYVR